MGGDGAVVGAWVGIRVVIGVASWDTCICRPTSSIMCRDIPECIRICDVPCCGSVTHSVGSVWLPLFLGGLVHVLLVWRESWVMGH